MVGVDVTPYLQKDFITTFGKPVWVTEVSESVTSMLFLRA